MERLQIGDADIEYEVRGEGEPVLLIPPALVIDALAHPLFAQPELTSRYQLIHYHRRGYMGTSLGAEPLTIALQACDAATLLRHLGLRVAQVVGYSFSGLIALQLTLDAPTLVHSLALLEPALRMVPSGKSYYELTVFPMVNAYRSGDKRAAVQIFGGTVFGPNWQPLIEQAVPGIVEQALRDVGTFMQEQPAIRDWNFGPVQAEPILQPVLSVLGARSHPLFQEGRPLLHSWFPQTKDVDVQSTHLLQMQDPEGVAHGLTDFLARHPIT